VDTPHRLRHNIGWCWGVTVRWFGNSSRATDVFHLSHYWVVEIHVLCSCIMVEPEPPSKGPVIQIQCIHMYCTDLITQTTQTTRFAYCRIWSNQRNKTLLGNEDPRYTLPSVHVRVKKQIKAYVISIWIRTQSLSEQQNQVPSYNRTWTSTTSLFLPTINQCFHITHTHTITLPIPIRFPNPIPAQASSGFGCGLTNAVPGLV